MNAAPAAGRLAGLPPGAEAVILFDGVCNLCEGAVKFIVRRDPHGRFAFAPLQSPVAARLLREAGGADAAGPPDASDSMILIDVDGVHLRSDAALRIARRLRAPWSAVWVFRFLPRPMRDGLYRFIAHHRYGWFGRKEACMVPTPELQRRFLA